MKQLAILSRKGDLLIIMITILIVIIIVMSIIVIIIVMIIIVIIVIVIMIIIVIIGIILSWLLIVIVQSGVVLKHAHPKFSLTSGEILKSCWLTLPWIETFRFTKFASGIALQDGAPQIWSLVYKPPSNSQ